MFTSFKTSNLESEAFAAGIRRVIIKSESLAELVGCVRTLVKEAA
jgi:hypothetical protein